MTPEDSVSEPVFPEAGGNPADPQARAVRLLAEVVQLAADRAAAESRVEAQFQAARGAAGRAAQDIRQALAAELEIERRDVDSDYAEQRRHALSRFQHETSTVEREFADLQRQVAEEFQKAGKKAERKLKEARWEAEMLFEASKEIAPRQLKEFEGLVDSWLLRARTEREEAQKRLTEWRQPWRDAPPVAEKSTAEPLDAMALLQQRVNFVIAQRLQLTQLRVPPVAASLALVWVFVFGGLLLSALAVGTGLGGNAAVAAGSICAALGVAVSIYLRKLARSQVEAIYPSLGQAALEAETLAERALDEARARAAAQQAEVVQRRERGLGTADAAHQAALAAMTARRDVRLQGPAVSYPNRLEEIALRRDRDLELAEAVRTRREAEIRQKEAQRTVIEGRYRRQTEEIEQRYATQWQTLTETWRSGMDRVKSLTAQIWGTDGVASGGRWLADWSQFAGSWAAATAIPPAIRFGQFRVNMDQIPHGVPASKPLAELTPQGFSLPAIVPFPESSSLLFKAHGGGRRVAIEAMQSVMLRLLVTIPPGKLRFTIVDPVGLGENFAAFMHLVDYNEALVASRIWTEPRHIEQRLADLSEHMENVIQKYLRNEFESIEQYNRQAGEIAEPFRFLVIADFPANFSEAAQRRLISIAASGARCGVSMLMMVDTQLPLAAGISLNDFERHGATLVWSQGQFVWKNDSFGQFKLTLDAPPPPAQVTEMLQTAGQYAVEAGRVEVPFEVIAPAPRDFWTSSARSGIEVPLGRAGATRLQSMKLGQGTSQHVLIAGKTGSGKSTLLHALITNLALRYSPDEIELYLVDFKQGVEFKTYATHQLPHARVVAIESDREFGVSVLARLDAELKARAEGFRALGVQDLAGYREADSSARMPRILVIVDEFQEFFVEDDRIAQDAALLLDRLVRQGRAFGIHVLLGSQTLAGTYTLARSTIGQMAVRIALQCSETDAHLILSEDNSAARLLSRAGEAIYNDSNGLVEGNHPFQIVWLSDDRREKYLEQVQSLAERHAVAPRPQVVFEGNVPADPQRNDALVQLLLAGRPASSPPAARAWLGEAVAIKEPTSVTFRRQSGTNLLIVGQNEEAALGILTTAMISLSAQHPLSRSHGAQFYIFDGSAAGSNQAAMLAHLQSLTPDPVRVVTWREMAAAVNELACEVERRQKPADVEFAPVYVLIYGLQKLRELRRQEDEFGFSRPGENRPPDPAKQFGSVLRDGPAVGVHSLVWCDSVNNLNRAWDRQTLREFEMRVAFQMSGNDSSTLIDTPAASKLGTHRALFHSEEQEVLEKFRPYRPPTEAWLDWVRERLHGPPDQRDSLSQRLAV
jgi:ABC-type multidrug transport system fused ATPase/permease subunit